MNLLPILASKIPRSAPKISKRAITSIRNVMGETDYTNWSKKELLKRIFELEGRSTDATDVAAVSEVAQNKEKGSVVDQVAQKKKGKTFDFNKYQKRKIALRFAYLGWNYQGLALQAEGTELPTVEGKIMEALYKVKLIGTPEQKDCDFSRCGRTDRGVSAMNQVISLRVRSKLSEEELKDEKNDIREVDYIKVLNQALPEDIRMHSVCLRPGEDFDARFSCTFRHYKYIFDGRQLDIAKMNEAAAMFLGENDFRNFCKIDASKQINNFKRNILMSHVEELADKKGFYVFNLRGTAFLWHQVRCMIAVLLSVGQRLEQPEIVKQLLDPQTYESRPVYKMAHDVPLVLYDCGFKNNVKWTGGPARELVIHHEVNNQWNDYKVKSYVVDFLKEVTDKNIPQVHNKTIIHLGDGIGQTVGKYEPFAKRRRLDTAQIINAKWLATKAKKNN